MDTNMLKGDLADERTEAIVNNANENLYHGGGLARHIVDIGGEIIQEQSKKYIQKHGTLRTTDVVATASGSLSCDTIFHAVGPRWSGQQKGQRKQELEKTFTNVFEKAHELKLETISLSAISTGIFHFPITLCAEIAYHTIQKHFNAMKKEPTLKIIRFVINDDETLGEFLDVFKAEDKKSRKQHKRKKTSKVQ